MYCIPAGEYATQVDEVGKCSRWSEGFSNGILLKSEELITDSRYIFGRDIGAANLHFLHWGNPRYTRLQNLAVGKSTEYALQELIDYN